MKKNPSIVLIAVILLLNITGYSSAGEKKTNVWITEKEASLPPM